MALRWLLQQEVVPSIVFGARTMEQLESVIEVSSGWELTDEEVSYFFLLNYDVVLYIGYLVKAVKS